MAKGIVESKYVDQTANDSQDQYLKGYPVGTSLSCDYHPLHFAATSYPKIKVNFPDGRQTSSIIAKGVYEKLPAERREGNVELSEQRAREINDRILQALDAGSADTGKLLNPFRRHDGFGRAMSLAQDSIRKVSALDGIKNSQLDPEAITIAVRQLLMSKQQEPFAQHPQHSPAA